jgi:hypothetical protein
VKLIADAMLGSLARWLRVLGVDVAYDPALDDAALVARAVAEDRLILTRDRKLVERRLARRHLLIQADRLEEQLLQVVKEVGVAREAMAAHSRCLRCNTVLVPLAAEEARRRVPLYVARTQERFHTCPDCGRVYWPATHVARMRGRLAGMGIELPGG